MNKILALILNFLIFSIVRSILLIISYYLLNLCLNPESCGDLVFINDVKTFIALSTYITYAIGFVFVLIFIKITRISRNNYLIAFTSFIIFYFFEKQIRANVLIFENEDLNLIFYLGFSLFVFCIGSVFFIKRKLTT